MSENSKWFGPLNFVYLLLGSACSAASLWGYVVHTQTELADARELNTMLKGEVADLRESAPTIQKKYLDCKERESDANSRSRILEVDLQKAAKRSEEAEAELAKLKDETERLRQDRPLVIATTELRRGQRHRFTQGLLLEYTGTKGDMVLFRYDGSKPLGLPLQTLDQTVPLRFEQSLGTVLGIQPLTLSGDEKVVKVNLIRFPPKWDFSPVLEE